jgi:hypothetical protein
MDLKNHQWIACTHKDTKNLHIHILTTFVTIILSELMITSLNNVFALLSFSKKLRKWSVSNRGIRQVATGRK